MLLAIVTVIDTLMIHISYQIIANRFCLNVVISEILQTFINVTNSIQGDFGRTCSFLLSAVKDFQMFYLVASKFVQAL